MDADLFATARTHGGVFTRQIARSHGISDEALLGMRRRRDVASLGRSVYAVATALPDRSSPGYEVALHVLKAKAAPLVYPDAHLCGVSLLAVAGIDVHAADLRRVELVRDVRQEVLTQFCRIRPRNDVVRPTPPEHLVPGGQGVPAAVAGAAVQLAMDHGFLAGVCSADSALHDGWTTAADLASAVAALEHWPRAGRAHTMLALADGRAESVGESRLRVLLVLGGIPVEPQHVVRAGRTVIACCDLKVKGSRLVIEFDGKTKYGAGDSEVLWKEKRREDGIRRKGYAVERVIWVELHREALLLARVRAAIAVAAPDATDMSAPQKYREDPTRKPG